MNIEGTYTLQAPPTEVWHSLLDRELLQYIIPGVETIEQVNEHTYAIVFNIKHAPLEGAYQGQVTLSEQHSPCHCRLTFEGKGDHGTISGDGSLHLHEHNEATIIAYKGTLTYSKQETLLQPKLIKGAAKLLTQQFFTALATHLASKEYREGNSEEHNGQIRGKIILRLPHATTEPPIVHSIFSKIIQLLGLGGGDYEQEEHWERLLRNASIISGFLLLVWVGTRLPSRKEPGRPQIRRDNH
jgi:carbon monoxide dehydrogenase subunit G